MLYSRSILRTSEVSFSIGRHLSKHLTTACFKNIGNNQTFSPYFLFQIYVNFDYRNILL